MTALDQCIYQKLAQELARLIRAGRIAAGERLPSLREVCRRQGVSLSTALQAYRQLEADGLIEARPKSGYFVRAAACGAVCEPAVSRPPTAAGEITVAGLALDILRQARRPGLLNLGTVVPAAELLPLARLGREMGRLARSRPELIGRYEVPAGHPLLRAQIARQLARHGCHCRADDIIVTNGCMEAITLALRAVARRGDTIAIESPTFYGILQGIEALGLKALELPTHPRDGIDLDALQQALATQPVAAILLVPSFNNPLGSNMPLANRRRLAALIERHDVPLIEDDIYGDLTFEAPRLPPVKAFDGSGKVLLCSSFSKTLAPGLRLGYVLPGRYAAQVEHLKLLGNIASAGLPQLTLANYLKHGGQERVVQQAARVYRQRSERLRRLILERFPEGTRVTRPQGGFVLWVELPEHLDGVRLYEAALAAGVAVTPGVIFSPRGDYRHHLRISCGQLDDAALAQGVDVLARLAWRQARGG